MNPLDELQSRLGYRFGDAALLRRALTHRSHGVLHNERLEFLGDAVLNLLVAQMLYADGEADEGRLSYARAALVREETLAELASELQLGAQLQLGQGEQRSGGRRRSSILADALEAVIGTVYLDGGMHAAVALGQRLYAGRLRALDGQVSTKDAKTRLQELLQARRLPVPVYRVCQTSGPQHAQSFAVTCEIPALALCSSGDGASRRAAEQQAAQSMIALFEQCLQAGADAARGEAGGCAP